MYLNNVAYVVSSEPIRRTESLNTMCPTINTVVTVDDDPIIQQVFMSFFAKHGARNVLPAWDGAHAISILNTIDAIDLIVCDLHMPKTDGVEFMAYLSEIGCRIPVVIVSSADKLTVLAAKTLANANNLNLIGSLPKPLDFDELEKVLGLSS